MKEKVCFTLFRKLQLIVPSYQCNIVYEPSCQFVQCMEYNVQDENYMTVVNIKNKIVEQTTVLFRRLSLKGVNNLQRLLTLYAGAGKKYC